MIKHFPVSRDYRFLHLIITGSATIRQANNFVFICNVTLIFTVTRIAISQSFIFPVIGDTMLLQLTIIVITFLRSIVEEPKIIGCKLDPRVEMQCTEYIILLCRRVESSYTTGVTYFFNFFFVAFLLEIGHHLKDSCPQGEDEDVCMLSLVHVKSFGRG